MTKQKNNTTTNGLFTLFSIFAHFVGVSLILLGGVVFLIGAYHATLVLLACAMAPIFMVVIPTVTLFLCGGVVFLNHPVHNLLCLISVFFSTVVLYLYVGAEFLAFLFLIVYVGAIAILFLFVIMLLQLKVVAVVQWGLALARAKVLAVSVVIAVVGLTDILATSLSSFFTISDTTVFNNTYTAAEELVWFVNSKTVDILIFSNLLYGYHAFLFFAAGLLLLTAMLGAIILATSSSVGESPAEVIVPLRLPLGAQALGCCYPEEASRFI